MSTVLWPAPILVFFFVFSVHVVQGSKRVEKMGKVVEVSLHGYSLFPQVMSILNCLHFTKLFTLH